MTPHARLRAFGAAGVFTVAGVLCGLFVSGLTGQLLAIVLISLGLGGAVLLVFLEIGLSEDRDRAHEADRQRQPLKQQRKPGPTSRLSKFRWPRRPT